MLRLCPKWKDKELILKQAEKNQDLLILFHRFFPINHIWQINIRLWRKCRFYCRIHGHVCGAEEFLLTEILI